MQTDKTKRKKCVKPRNAFQVPNVPHKAGWSELERTHTTHDTLISRIFQKEADSGNPNYRISRFYVAPNSSLCEALIFQNKHISLAAVTAILQLSQTTALGYPVLKSH